MEAVQQTAQSIQLQTDSETSRDAMGADDSPPPRLGFMVVGIGASAGGLEAFTEFFNAMPADRGIAFVLVQHLSPKHESLVAEILQKHTAMRVLQVEDGMLVEPDHVYVIRPGHTMTIKDGRLHLGDSLSKPRHSRPVDDFFRSLAEEQRERSVCIILSGMGSNGTAGAQAIKVVGGVSIAQEPDSAKFPSMPRSLIDTNLADFILRPSEMPELLLRYSSHAYVNGTSSPEAIARRESHQLNEVLSILRARVRQDFAGYKKPTLVRRIQRRMSLNQHLSLSEYARMLRQTPAEVVNLSDDLMIHVTGFFRDSEVWDTLCEKVIRPLIAEKQDQASIRVWVTACATGEEAYTLAMLLVEAAESADKQFDIKVFATDMAERALLHARAGIFAGGIESEILPERLARFFDKDDSMYRIKKELRELVVFAPQNVLQDPPFSRLDIITCRNLLIYLEPEMQQKVVSLLHFGLREGGTLVLGNSETIGDRDDLFEPIDKKLRIYRRIGPTRHGTIAFPLPVSPSRELDAADRTESRMVSRASLSQITNKMLLDTYTPPAIVVDRHGRIVYFHGETELFLDQPRGEPTREVLVLARQFVRGPIRVALHRAIETGENTTVKDGLMPGDDGNYRIEVTAAPLDRRGVPGYYLISFTRYPVASVPFPPQEAVEDSDLAEELRSVRDELQSTIEELQTSNEEMKASNEEVTSINEELQSTNEELETSKEELQSLNEELTTVNTQLQAKMEELESTTNDLASLLSSTDIAVIFLDTQFRIRRFTPAIKKLIDLIPSDIGRPLSDLARKFEDPALADDAAVVLESLVPVEKEIKSAGNYWFVRRVLPYRTTDNRIDGVVVTFVDITERLRAEAAVRSGEDRYRELFNSMDQAFVITEAIRDETGAIFDFRCGSHNPAFARQIGPADPSAISVETLFPGVDQVWMERWIRVLQTGEPFRLQDYVPGLDRWLDVFASRVGGIESSKVALLITDITARKKSEAALKQSEERFRLATQAAQMGFWDWNVMTNHVDWDPVHIRMFGLPEDLSSGDIQQWMQRIHPDDRELFAAKQREVIDSKTVLAVELRAVRPDGSIRWISAHGQTRIDGRGNVTHVIGAAIDITDRKITEQERAALLEAEQHARAVAESTSAAKDQFLANASHELRTPLSAILLWSKLLKENDSNTAMRAQGLAAMEYSALSQEKLIEDLLDSARMAGGKMHLDLKPADLREVISSALNTIRPAASAKAIELSADLQDVGPVSVDADRLQQVLWNLISNAVKFTPAGGRVAVDLSRGSADVKIRVTDTGVGISKTILPQIFSRFFQVDTATTRRQGGLGLGLAISRQLVELHGGTIEAQSSGIDQGATFIISLPTPRAIIRR